MSRRAMCSLCERPAPVCLCSFVREFYSDIEVIIWQHPSERAHPKGSALLLSLCLPNSRLVCVEVATAKELRLAPEQCALLYPIRSDVSYVDESGMQLKPIKQLLLLDGTWRKSRKILHLNSWLLQLPRVSVDHMPGRYSIRKAENKNQLSTFEAGIYGLQQASPSFDGVAAMEVFQKFIQQYKSFLPHKTHNK